MKCYQMFFFVSKPFTFFQLASRGRHGIVWCPHTTACFIGMGLFTRDRDKTLHPFLPFGVGVRFDPRVRAPMVVTRIKFKFHGRISFVKKKNQFRTRNSNVWERERKTLWRTLSALHGWWPRVIVLSAASLVSRSLRSSPSAPHLLFLLTAPRVGLTSFNFCRPQVAAQWSRARPSDTLSVRRRRTSEKSILTSRRVVRPRIL